MRTIATWNLNQSTHGHKIASEQLSHVAEINADVWVFTEAHPDFSPGTGYQLVAQSSPTDELPKGHRWVTVWARDAQRRDISTCDAEFATCSLLTFTNTKKLLVYGTVLPWQNYRWHDHPAEDGQAFIAALDAQASDLKKFRNEHPDALACYAGDFNQDLDDKHYYGSKKGRAALNAALGELKLTCHTAGDNDRVLKATDKVHATIDHICTSSATHSANGCWPQTHAELKGLSDHFGTWVTIDPSVARQ